MTATQQVQWIALPAGADPDSNRLRVSVFIAPRLRTDGATLAPFTDFLDWPATVANAQFAVAVGATTIPATVTGEAPDSELWRALFGPGTPLVPYVFDDYADRPFVTYSVGDVVSTLQTLYARAAAMGADDLPRIHGKPNVEPPQPGLLDMFAALRGVTQGVLRRGVQNAEEGTERVRLLLEHARAASAARRAPGAARGGPVLEPLPADGSVARHFERALLFHLRPTATPVAMPENGQHYVESVDFHQMLSALGDQPWLLRKLGLIVDLAVDRDQIPTATAAAHGEFSVQPTWVSALAADSVDVTPHTAYVHQRVGEETFFCAAPHQLDPTAPADAPPIGLLPMPASAFALQQVDVDGSALKAVNLAATLDAIATRPDPGQGPLHEPQQSGLPAIRSSGLAVVRSGRASALQGTFGRRVEINDAVEHGAAHTLFAEDLVRGYRLDVFDTASGAWRSLHRRIVNASAEQLPAPLPGVEDEGFFQVSLSTPATAPGQAEDPNSEVYAHETLVTWDGWSLSVPRPGKSINRDPRAPNAADPTTLPSRVPNDPFTAMGLRIETTFASGTLPRLRFGRNYRVRVRLVDLAGNGPGVSEADHLLGLQFTATPALPVGGGSPYLRFEPVPSPVLVPAQRFDEGASVHRLVVRSNRDTTAEQYAVDFNASEIVTAGRHRTMVSTDDRHVAPPKVAFDLVERHGRLDAVVGSDGSAPTPEQQAAMRAAYEIARREKGSFDDPSLPDVEVIEIKPDPAQPQRYVVHHEAQLQLPYLPDPLATGAVFFGLPGMPAGAPPFQVLFDGPDWYSAQPFRLRLHDGAGAPEWDAAQRLLTVHLPQATTATVRVCSLFGGDLGQMGMLRWCEQVLAGEDLNRVITAIKENRSWLITPWQTLDLVHAVQQPLVTPDVQVFDVQRGQEQTWADLYGEIRLDVASTEKIDVVAAWNETVDDPAQPGPVVRQGQAAVFDLSLKAAALERTDTNPHEVPYSLRGGRLLTYFTPVARERGYSTPLAHQFGDTRYRRVTYAVVATTPFREYFPSEWMGRPDLLSRRSDPLERDVPASAPPAVPQVMYAVPTLGWESTQADGSTVRRRRGGGLRVYLERPWFSSGDGEMLGVVIGGPLTAPGQPEYPSITLLGQDPIRGGASLQFATPTSFPNASVVTDPIQPLERVSPVRVAAFAPAYDADTQRWFCDIDLATEDAYMPIVRLALVRYQSHAIPGCALSRIVLVDIVQTLPDRTLTLTRAPEDPSVVRISVVGPTYTSIHGGSGPTRSDDPVLARVVARVERRDPAIPDAFFGWRPLVETEVVLNRALAGVTATWTGTIRIPAGDGSPQRLVVVEEEHLAVDEQTPNAGGLGARVIYADRLEL